jgi:hypothetical protein
MNYICVRRTYLHCVSQMAFIGRLSIYTYFHNLGQIKGVGKEYGGKG